MRNSFIFGIFLMLGFASTSEGAHGEKALCDAHLLGGDIEYTVEHEALKGASRYIKSFTGEYGKLIHIERTGEYENGYVSLSLQFKDHLNREIPLVVIVDPSVPRAKFLISDLANYGNGRVYEFKNSVTIERVFKISDLAYILDGFKN